MFSESQARRERPSATEEGVGTTDPDPAARTQDRAPQDRE